MTTTARPLESVRDAPRAATLVEHPLRLAVLREAGEPRSATEIAARIGETRQKVNYHLGKLRDGGFVIPAGTRPARGLEERLYVATARRYLLSPAVLADLAPSPREVTDRLSADYLLALAARSQEELGRVTEEAAAAGQRVATLSIDADVHFATPGARTAFTEELHDAVLRLVARHSEPGVADARPYRLVVGAYPVPRDTPAGPDAPPSPSPPDSNPETS